MSSDDFSGDSFGDSSLDNFPTVRWPFFRSEHQMYIQNKFFQDGATIHFERLQGLQFWAPLFAFRDQIRVASVVKRVVSQSQGAQRRLTADEVNITSEYANKAARYLAWSHPVAFAGAIAAATNGRRTFKFPFYQPKMKSFDPYYFPRKSFSFLQGPSAAAVWHGFRFMAYAPLTWLASVIFFSSVAEWSFQAHVLRDSRLSALIQDNQRQQAAHQGIERQRTRQRMGVPDPPRVGLPRSPPSSRQPDDQVSSTPNYSSTSPTQQPDYQTSQDYEQQTGSLGDRSPTSPAPQSRWSRNVPSPPEQKGAPESRYAGQSPQSASWDSDPFDDDDASPVATSARRTNGRQAQSSSGTSSWDQVRQQSRSDAKKFERGDSSGQERGWAQLRRDKAPRDAQVSSSREGFAYTKQEEERERGNYEKDQAQKEFDALVEAERRGESSGSGGVGRR